ncbi:MAG: sporulation protein [Clostridia bacterium]|nr:sporulation protein [Clostridia bacterium]
MKLAKNLVTLAIALSLVVLPVLPADRADAASKYTYRYTTNYSYSKPANTTTTKVIYTLKYDRATGKYYLVQQPSTGTPAKPSQPAQPANPPAQEKPAPTPTQPAPSAPASNSQFEQQVVDLVNQERAKAGLKPLIHDPQLSQVARLKSQDMANKGYFSHTSPTYGSPFEMMKQYGISYRTAGENIAAGQRTPAQVVAAWMGSSGHRANILNANFTHIGVGYVAGGSYGHYWTQMFVGR